MTRTSARFTTNSARKVSKEEALLPVPVGLELEASQVSVASLELEVRHTRSLPEALEVEEGDSVRLTPTRYSSTYIRFTSIRTGEGLTVITGSSSAASAEWEAALEACGVWAAWAA